MPKISQQFRGLEGALGIQEPLDRINFLGSDISPVVDVDPGTLRLDQVVLEDTLVTSPIVEILFTAPAAGRFRLYKYITVVHNDPVPRDTRLNVREPSVPLNLFLALTPALLAGFALDYTAQVVWVPAAHQLRALCPGLAAGQTLRMSALVLDLPVGAAPLP